MTLTDPRTRSPVVSAPEVRIVLTRARTPADQVFRAGLIACASAVLVVVVAILGYLLSNAAPAWRYQGLSLITSDRWNPGRIPPSFGFLGPLAGSCVIAMVALVLAVPVAIAVALAINEYIPQRTKRLLTGLVDLLAALPSLVFGMWGLLFLDQRLFLTSRWLGHYGAFFPPFRPTQANYGRGLFEAGIVVGIMILPLITSISREVMSQVPRDTCEAALALGGTRWGMITDVVLPFSRSGILGGAMLGLGRALGETIAVLIILAADQRVASHILQPGGGSIAALIAQNFLGATALEQSALTVAGLTLFAVTLTINLGARRVVAHSGRDNAR